MSTQKSFLQELDEKSTDNLITLQSHILAEQSRHPGSTGTFSWILSAMSLSGKVISAKLRRARLDDVLGTLGTENVQGERQQKLDVIANETLLRCLGRRKGVAIVASEENDEPILLRDNVDHEGGYCVLFDPLDGSSNLDTCGGVGTIFSILKHPEPAATAEEAMLQPGTQQLAAGYILYGSSTVFVLTTGRGVSMFVLDPMIGAFLRVIEDLRIPKKAKTYSVNEGNRRTFTEGYQRYLDWAQQSGYSSRYAGAMVADVHRTLLQGGVFFYPPTAKAPEGKLRLMYEANPMSMIVEQAGGKAFAGKTRLLEVQPKALHQRTTVILGSPDEVDNVLAHL
ncbi:MAG: class 1 fructose-bisphosphatase [Planctomycetes bacterium]|nr:class 1 fructose-bisphosphatase [Planctomycetota bacterium]